MSKSVINVNSPEDFNFSLRSTLNSNLLALIGKYYGVNRITVTDEGNYACPQTGFYTWDGINCWVYNQENQDLIELYFKSIEEHNLFINILNLKAKKTEDKIQNKLYRYSERNGSWALAETYSDFDEEYLIGYNDYFTSIEKDILNHKVNKALLKSIGEFKSLSYLLYGMPGTGKTTLIKALSSKYNMDVYVINSITVKSTNISSILNPGKGRDKNVILLFEDFDRFLRDEETKQLMGQILNAMDGFDDTANTIRFFTGNECDVIFNEKALINRISGKYKFDYPTSEMFRNKLVKLLSVTKINLESETNLKKIDNFVSQITNRNITLRPFTAYCIRYLFNENCLDNINNFENIGDLLRSV